eukprot:scaffold725_cov117-Isochrysis_galbana.AAC.3
MPHTHLALRVRGVSWVWVWGASRRGTGGVRRRCVRVRGAWVRLCGCVWVRVRAAHADREREGRALRLPVA